MGVCPSCLIAATGTAAIADPELAGELDFEPPAVEELAARFPQLEVLELVGRGGMGAVYKARQRALDRVVALKILPPGIGRDPAFAERFTREARALAQLNHPSIVTLYEFGSRDGLFFFLMEFVDGVNLRQAMGAGSFSPEQALAVVPPVCEALQYAHERGIVHRDIKPENLLLDTAGRIKIADFGVARMLGGPGAGRPPRASLSAAPGDGATAVVGTPTYMAPEQSADPARADHRVDIYALGVVLYELLTGQAPEEGAIEIEAPSARIGVDVRIDEIVLRALEREPGRRFASAADFRTEVATVIGSSAGVGAEPRRVETPGLAWAGLAASGVGALAGAAALVTFPDPSAWFESVIPLSGLAGIACGLAALRCRVGRVAVAVGAGHLIIGGLLVAGSAGGGDGPGEAGGGGKDGSSPVATPGREILSPFVERELVLDDTMGAGFLDLDSGGVMAPSRELADGIGASGLGTGSDHDAKVSAWMRSNGADVGVAPGLAEFRAPALVFADTVTGPLAAALGDPAAPPASVAEVSLAALKQWNEKTSEPGATAPTLLTARLLPGSVFGFRTREGAIGVVEVASHRPDQVKLRFRTLRSPAEEAPRVARGSRRVKFVPVPGMDLKTSWSVWAKPSHLNPDGWAVMSRMTLGGKAMIHFPGEDRRRCEFVLVEGDDDMITVRIDDLLRDNVMKLSLLRGRPGEVTVDGEGFRVLYMETHVGPDDPDTSPFAFVLFTPAGQPAP